ncbi:MAG TPA: EAL domain-containing protein [Burkholderiales bacterium]|nr:EAL domain-containing protein [Burkholderiales bacterium]
MVGTYNYWMVFLSVVVAIVASYAALNLATRITASKGRAARTWLLGGAFSMGTGIWSMHFLGMLAFRLPIPMGYDVPVTLISMLIAILVSGFALYVVSRDTLHWQRLLLAGTLMGTGICAMHYTGMAAMQMSPPIIYDPTLLAASVAIAIAAALAALWIAFTLRDNSGWMRYAKLGSAIIMGFAITGMHYTGMAAARFAPDSVCLTGPLVDNSWMAGTIAGLTFVILCATLGLSILDARMASKTAKMVESLKHANDELQRQALHDPLTKLPNRVLLEDRLDQALVHSNRFGTVCAILFVDLDRFKTVNDSLGHFVGDELLRAVAARLETLVRGEDTVSRLGGDEFVILLKEIGNTADAAAVAHKILEGLGRAFRVHTHELFITPSIGVSLFPSHGKNAQTLLTNADAAMYSAKKQGRNNVQVFAADMNTSFPERLKLETDLRRALERHEFELHYQPMIDIQLGRMVGMEALLRWRHPDRGLVSPADFIPLAEETGLIVPIGRWVLEEACAQNKAWQNKGLGKLRVSVNISAVQFRQRDLLETIARALTQSGLAPEDLEVEITESTVMQNASEATVTLERLSRTGVLISIDDFGTGYSSLSYLKSFPINTLKIDRSFIRDISVDRDDAAIVRAIIGLAHNLRLRVVAEGVETEQQLEFLRSLESDEYQGYYCSRPLAAADFELYMRDLGQPLSKILCPSPQPG